MGKWWKDGYPLGFEVPIGDRGLIKGNGDRTVPLESAMSENIPSDDTVVLDSVHRYLPTYAQSDVLELLTGKRPTEEVRNTMIKNILIANVFSPVDIQIISPDGKRAGKDFETGKIVNEIEGAYYTGYETDNEFITIPNPQNGEYKIKTQGIGDGEYKIGVAKISEDEENPGQASESAVEISGTASPGEKDEAKIEVDGTEVKKEIEDVTPPIIIGSATEEPNENGWYDGDVTIHFEASDESGIESLTPDIVLDQEGENLEASGTAVDVFGNSASFAVNGINIDKTPPAIKIISPEDGKEYRNNGILKSDYRIEDFLSGEDKSRTALFLDGETFKGNSTDFSLLHLSQHKVKIAVFDKAGNKSEKEAVFRLTTDLGALIDNVGHYYDLGLIKKRSEKTHLINRLRKIQLDQTLLGQLENLRLFPWIRKNLARNLERQIEKDFENLRKRIDRNPGEKLDPKAGELLLESLENINFS